MVEGQVDKSQPVVLALPANPAQVTICRGEGEVSVAIGLGAPGEFPGYRPSATGDRFMTTKPARSKCSTRRFTTISGMSSSALWTLRAPKAQRERQR